jgi:para-aminobenzoate synthetase
MPPVIARDVLAQIAAGGVGTARRWDWIGDRPGDVVDVFPVPYLVLDGCGSGSRVIRPFLSLLVWVDAPEDVRRARAMARDGDVYGPWWDVWAVQERALFAAEQTMVAADARVRST